MWQFHSHCIAAYRKPDYVKVREVWPYWQSEKTSQHIQRISGFEAQTKYMPSKPGLGFEDGRYKWAAAICKQALLITATSASVNKGDLPVKLPDNDHTRYVKKCQQYRNNVCEQEVCPHKHHGAR